MAYSAPHGQTDSGTTSRSTPTRSEPPAISNVGDLRASGHRFRTVKAELRDNLVARLRAGEPSLPGIVGFEDTVTPEVERSILAGHDFVLLGERGQGKTRLMRTLAGLLDEWTPVIDGSELHEHPYAPITNAMIARAADLGDALPVSWWHCSERYGEKLATPDTSVGDLIGDIDPTKLAEGRNLGDPETVSYGLLPRANRGIFGLNELPDLAERIQVGLFNVLEERDIQIRGYALRLPLDLLVVASANPEDYTNRGRIITPLKDRFGAEIRTHYPEDTEAEVELIRQEAELPEATELPDHLVEVIAQLVYELRGSSAIDQRSGVSARFAVAAAEAVAASALRRHAIREGDGGAADADGGPEPAVARIGDLPGVIGTLRGKLEFESGEEGREDEVLSHQIRLATAAVYRERLTGVDLSGFTDAFAARAAANEGSDEESDAGGLTVETGDLVTARELLAQFGTVPGLAGVLSALGVGEDNVNRGQVAAAVEFVLEGLYLTRRLSKDSVGGVTVYGS